MVWQSRGSYGTDADWSIQAQRFDSSATPQGSQIQVNSYTTGDQQKPAVTMDGSGNFVVLWQSVGSPDTDSDQTSIQGQLFDASGTRVGGQFQVNAYTTGPQDLPEVSATDENGNFVVVWNADSGFGTDTFKSVQARRFTVRGVFGDGFESDDMSFWALSIP